MQHFRLVSLLAVAGLTLSVITWASSRHGSGVDLKQVPPAVMKTVLRVARGAKISEIEREQVNGQIVYAVEIEVGDVEVEVTIDEQGNILDVEIESEEGDAEDDEDLWPSDS